MNRADEIMKLMRDGAEAKTVFDAIWEAIKANAAERRDMLELLALAERRHGKPEAPVVIVRR